MNNDVTSSIRSAILRLGLNVKELNATQARNVNKEAIHRYVVGSPRAWWMSLTVQPETADSTVVKLMDVIPGKTGRCWLIPEVDSSSGPVFDVEVRNIQAILNECPFFEYYVVAKDFSWLIVESDHNEFFVCRSK